MAAVVMYIVSLVWSLAELYKKRKMKLDEQNANKKQGRFEKIGGKYTGNFVTPSDYAYL